GNAPALASGTGVGGMRASGVPPSFPGVPPSCPGEPASVWPGGPPSLVPPSTAPPSAPDPPEPVGGAGEVLLVPHAATPNARARDRRTRMADPRPEPLPT